MSDGKRDSRGFVSNKQIVLQALHFEDSSSPTWPSLSSESICKARLRMVSDMLQLGSQSSSLIPKAAIPTKRAKTPITIPAVSPLDRLLLLLTPDAAFVFGGEEPGVDDDVGEEAVRTVEDNVVLVPAGESTRMLDVAAGVCVGGGEARVV
jgi:hypothetical protein